MSMDLEKLFCGYTDTKTVVDAVDDDFYTEVMRKKEKALTVNAAVSDEPISAVKPVCTEESPCNIQPLQLMEMTRQTTTEKSVNATQEAFLVAQGVVATDEQDVIVQFEENSNTTEVDVSEVKTQKYSDAVSYPCLWLQADSFPAYKAKALNALLYNGVFADDVQVYPVYLQMHDEVLHIGYIDSRLLKEVLAKEVFALFNKSIKLTEKNELTGEMMYAMCSC